MSSSIPPSKITSKSSHYKPNSEKRILTEAVAQREQKLPNDEVLKNTGSHSNPLTKSSTDTRSATKALQQPASNNILQSHHKHGNGRPTSSGQGGGASNAVDPNASTAAGATSATAPVDAKRLTGEAMVEQFFFTNQRLKPEQKEFNFKGTTYKFDFEKLHDEGDRWSTRVKVSGKTYHVSLRKKPGVENDQQVETLVMQLIGLALTSNPDMQRVAYKASPQPSAEIMGKDAQHISYIGATWKDGAPLQTQLSVGEKDDDYKSDYQYGPMIAHLLRHEDYDALINQVEAEAKKPSDGQFEVVINKENGAQDDPKATTSHQGNGAVVSGATQSQSQPAASSNPSADAATTVNKNAEGTRQTETSTTSSVETPIPAITAAAQANLNEVFLPKSPRKTQQSRDTQSSPSSSTSSSLYASSAQGARSDEHLNADDKSITDQSPSTSSAEDDEIEEMLQALANDKQKS